MCSVSKQHAVIPSQVFELEDGSSSYKDFAMTRNNRFTSAGQASKNIIQPPSCVLHFYNVPPCISEDDLQRVSLGQSDASIVVVVFIVNTDSG